MRQTEGVLCRVRPHVIRRVSVPLGGFEAFPAPLRQVLVASSRDVISWPDVLGQYEKVLTAHGA